MAATLAALAVLIRSGVDSIDRVQISARVLFWGVAVFGPRALVDLRILRALIAIVHNESAGDPSNYLGDATLGGGPSIGPMQVYRSTAKDLGLWTAPAGVSIEEERATYAQLSTDESLGIHWGVLVFKDKLGQAQGDIREAIRRYNGSGPAAEKYADKAVAWAATAPRNWDLS